VDKGKVGVTEESARLEYLENTKKGRRRIARCLDIAVTPRNNFIGNNGHARPSQVFEPQTCLMRALLPAGSGNKTARFQILDCFYLLFASMFQREPHVKMDYFKFLL